MQQETNDHQLPPVGGQGDSNQIDDSSTAIVPAQVTPVQSSSPVGDDDQSFESGVSTEDVQSLPAEDVDLIEKVWVEKAKEIVQNTLGDPYKQNQQLSEVKAAYIKKRYSKDIKVSEQGK